MPLEADVAPRRPGAEQVRVCSEPGDLSPLPLDAAVGHPGALRLDAQLGEGALVLDGPLGSRRHLRHPVGVRGQDRVVAVVRAPRRPRRAAGGPAAAGSGATPRPARRRVRGRTTTAHRPRRRVAGRRAAGPSRGGRPLPGRARTTSQGPGSPWRRDPCPRRSGARPVSSAYVAQPSGRPPPGARVVEPSKHPGRRAQTGKPVLVAPPVAAALALDVPQRLHVSVDRQRLRRPGLALRTQVPAGARGPSGSTRTSAGSRHRRGC